MKTIIHLENVNKYFQTGEKSIHVLKDFSLAVQEGEFLAVMGRSGSGKSTFLKIAGTLEKADSGIVLLEGKNLSQLSENEICCLRQLEIGFVFQQYQLLPDYTLWDNVCMPLYIAHRSPDFYYLRQIFEQIGLWDRRMDYPEQLSGGEQQRVAIARALAAKPSVILADEPTGNLDYYTGQEIMKMFCTLREAFGQTVIMVTHDMETANYADRIVSIEDGKLQ